MFLMPGSRARIRPFARQYGTWVPSVTATSTPGTPTYSAQSGNYIRYGSLVTAWFSVVLSGWSGSPLGNVTITGLPFPSKNSPNFFGGVSVNAYSVTGLAIGGAGLTGFISPNTTTIQLNQNMNTGTTSLASSNAGTTPSFFGFAEYSA